MCEENNDGETSQSRESEMKASAGQSRKRSAFELLVDQQQQERSSSKSVGSASEILAASHQSASAVPSTSYLNSSMTNNALFQHASARDGGLYHHHHHQEEEPSSRRKTYPAREEQEIARRPSSSHHSSSNSAISSVMPQHRFDFGGSATVTASSISSSTPATSQQELVPSHLFPSLQQSSSGDRSSQFAAGINLPYGISSNNMIDPSSSSSSALLTAGVHNSVPVAQVQKEGNASKKEGTEKKDKLSKDDTTSNKRKKPGRKKKKEGAPKRPMSAYNFFFQEERKRLLDALPKQDNGSKKKNRRDRSPHNKISFSALGKTIGKNWKQVGSIEMARYEELAKRDKDRYLRELKVFEAKEQLEAAAGDFQTPMKSSESISSISAKNEWFATNRSREHDPRFTTSREQYDFESNSMQYGNASEMNIPFNMSQYPHFLYQQNSETSSLLGNASYANHATNYQASQQAPYTIQAMHQQQMLPKSVSSIQECQNPALFSSATLKDEDIIEPIPLEMDTLNSQTDTQEDSPTLYYFEKESGNPNS